MNLTTLTEEHAPHPLGLEIQGRQMAGEGNVNVIAQGIALRNCPASELPRGLREARAKIDAAAAMGAKAETELNAKLADWQRYQTLLADIADRRKHLAFAEERLVLAKGAVASLDANFMAIERLGEPKSWAGAVELERDAKLCEGLAKRLSRWIERKSAEIAELDAQATELEKRYGE